MDIREAIRTTGAVRAFTDEPVPDEVVAGLLDDARFAASGGNRQPWRVVVVTDRVARRRLADLMQPVWDEYVAARGTGRTPFNSIDHARPAEVVHAPNPLLAEIESIPVVLVVAADLRDVAAMDRLLDRTAIVPGASIYPFCWNVLLSARARGLGGVMTTFLAAAEPDAASLLRLPAHHAIAAVLFVGHPVHQPTKLSRRPVAEFARRDTFDGAPFG